MKLLVTYDYQYFTVYHVWAKENTYFKWAHAPTDGVGMGQASYYKGQLKTVDAFNPKVVGLIWRGHYNWSDRDTVPDYWSRVGEWQKCIAFEDDLEWWC